MVLRAQIEGALIEKRHELLATFDVCGAEAGEEGIAGAGGVENAAYRAIRCKLIELLPIPDQRALRADGADGNVAAEDACLPHPAQKQLPRIGAAGEQNDGAVRRNCVEIALIHPVFRAVEGNRNTGARKARQLRLEKAVAGAVNEVKAAQILQKLRRNRQRVALCRAVVVVVGDDAVAVYQLNRAMTGLAVRQNPAMLVLDVPGVQCIENHAGIDVLRQIPAECALMPQHPGEDGKIHGVSAGVHGVLK